MKIAIPTEDGFTINPEMSDNKGFLISTIQFGEVIQQDMRWIPASERVVSVQGLYKAVEDCDKVIVREIGNEQKIYLQMHNIEIVTTKETIITKVLMQFLNEIMKRESNICCNP